MIKTGKWLELLPSNIYNTKINSSSKRGVKLVCENMTLKNDYSTSSEKTLKIITKFIPEKDNVITEAKEKHVKMKLIFICMKRISEQIVSDTEK